MNAIILFYLSGMPVSNSRSPLRINTGFLLNTPIGTYRDINFEIPQLQLKTDFTLENFKGVVRINRTPQGMLVEGNFSGDVATECVRCLEIYQQDTHIEFKELFAFRNDQITDSGLRVPEDGNIDIAPLVYEYALIDFPIKPLCRPDCKGLCTICGANLNEDPCEHQKRVLEE